MLILYARATHYICVSILMDRETIQQVVVDSRGHETMPGFHLGKYVNVYRKMERP